MKDETKIDSLGATQSLDAVKPARRFSPGDKIERFLVIDILGEGGMGVVLRAYDPDLDRKVAIKLLRVEHSGSSGKQRLLREAQAMAKLAHQNVVTVYEVGVIGDQVFIVMEYVRGQTMARWRRSAKRSPKEVVETFAAAGAGLAAAHRAGLVHRDFKPDNVLISQEGRVQVTDFGLVGLSGEAEDISGDGLDISSSGQLSVTLTRAGAIIGTPKYMAPEQFLATASDGRTDQFSFCVALYETLFGSQPFAGRSFSVLADNTIHGRLLAAPKGKCSARVRKAIAKGLSSRPEDRFANMDDLLEEFSDGFIGRHKAVMVVASVGAVALASLLAIQSSADTSQKCKRQRGLADSFWAPQHRQKVQDAFVATGHARALTSSDRVAQKLDAYTESWLDMHLKVCRSTYEQHTQSEQVFDLKLRCLERRKQGVVGLVDELTLHADRTMVDGSLSALNSLPSVRGCDDGVALAAPFAAPEEPSLAAKVYVLRERLDRIASTKLAGRSKEALAPAMQLLVDTRTIDYAPLLAETLLLLGQVQEATGANGEAETTLYEAIWAAESGHHDRAAAGAWLELLWLVGDKNSQFAASQKVAGHARAAIARLGNPDSLRTDYLNHFGNVLVRAGKLDEALLAYSESLEIRERLFGDESLGVAVVLNNLSVLHRNMGNFEIAALTSLRSLEIKKRELGPEHPRIATAMTNLGVALSEVGQLDLGISYFTQALELKRSALGTENRSYAIGASNLGDALADAKRCDEALPYYEEAKHGFSVALSSDHVLLAYPLAGQGNCLVSTGHETEAIAPLRRALQLLGDVPSKELAAIHFDLAKALWATGNKEVARVSCDKAEAGYAAAGKTATAQLEEVRVWRGRH